MRAAVVATHSLDLAELLGPGGGGGDLAAAPVDLKDTSGFPLCRVTLSVGAQRAARALSMPTERATADERTTGRRASERANDKAASDDDAKEGRRGRREGRRGRRERKD